MKKNTSERSQVSKSKYRMRVQSKGNSGNETGDHLTMSSGERRAGHLVTWSLGPSVTPD